MAIVNSMTPPSSPLPDEIVTENNNAHPDPGPWPFTPVFKRETVTKKKPRKIREEKEQLKKQLVANRKAEKYKTRKGQILQQKELMICYPGSKKENL